MSKILIEQDTIIQAVSDFDDIRSAITEKNVDVPSSTPTSEYGNKIRCIEVGGGGVAESDINFYDYDGTLVAAWTLAQAQTATSLPEGPTHDRLVFQGWTKTLEYINALTMPLDVGAMYTTVSGASEFDITLTTVTGLEVTLQIYTVSTGKTINVIWGDGSSESATTTTTGVKTFTHSYTSIGQYTTSVDSTGSYYPYGASTSPYNMFNVTPSYICTAARLGDRCTSIGTYAFRSCHSLTSITIPSSVTSIGSYAFHSCYNLTNITIPSSVTSIGTYVFYSCYSLTSVIIPSGVTSIGTYVFYSCYSLTSVIIPSGVTSIGTYAFQYCYSLTSVIIPSGVTSIGTYAFQYCLSLTNITIPSSVTSIGSYVFQYCYRTIEYVMLRSIPPTLSGTNAFLGINGICKIRVPSGSLEAYQTATNWATYANYMEEWS